MKIIVNGSERALEGAPTLQSLLDTFGTPAKRCAVELNGEIVPKAALGATALKEGDRIEIIQFVGGG